MKNKNKKKKKKKKKKNKINDMMENNNKQKTNK